MVLVERSRINVEIGCGKGLPWIAGSWQEDRYTERRIAPLSANNPGQDDVVPTQGRDTSQIQAPAAAAEQLGPGSSHGCERVLERFFVAEAEDPGLFALHQKPFGRGE